MTDVETCIIFDAPFEGEPGLGVVFFEEEAAAQVVKEQLRGDGFRATVCGGREGPRRFWYLTTNAPIGDLWCAISCFFDAYIRFEAQPGGGLQVRESCACAGCRAPDDLDINKLEKSVKLDGQESGGNRGTTHEFDREILN